MEIVLFFTRIRLVYIIFIQNLSKTHFLYKFCVQVRIPNGSRLLKRGCVFTKSSIIIVAKFNGERIEKQKQILNYLLLIVFKLKFIYLFLFIQFCITIRLWTNITNLIFFWVKITKKTILIFCIEKKCGWCDFVFLIKGGQKVGGNKLLILFTIYF